MSNRKGAGIGIVLITFMKLIMEMSLRLGFLATNNEAEYETLLAGVTMVRQLGRDVVEFYSDSRLVVGQLMESLKLGMRGCRDTLLRFSFNNIYWSLQ